MSLSKDDVVDLMDNEFPHYRLHDTYRPVSKTSFVDETLFARTEGIYTFFHIFNFQFSNS